MMRWRSAARSMDPSAPCVWLPSRWVVPSAAPTQGSTPACPHPYVCAKTSSSQHESLGGMGYGTNNTIGFA
jgi:hypothetical protein